MFTVPPIFGTIGAPTPYGSAFSGLVPFLNNVLRLIFVIAGLFGLFNFIIGGFGFLSSGGDPKGIEKAWGRITNSLIGLIIIVGSFVLAAIFGYLLFGNPMAILYPQIYGPQAHPCEPWPTCCNWTSCP